MLDSNNKKIIDNLCDILVGKFPVPQDQVDQITVALTYKFMCEMDAESVALGGKKSFFLNEWEKYSWDKLFDSRTTGNDRKNIYSYVIENLQQNENLPPLFRQIFSNPPNPLNDQVTLNDFLKTIELFSYKNSETLGNSYEYLLSKTGAQGTLGQFRTPRHIIDLMVSLIEPKSNDLILDPSCGTAGFLVSAFKFILQNESDLGVEDTIKLGENLNGYDIEPKMIRISLLNLFLQGFKTPKIFEYDALTSDDRWNDYFDIILANPPFFSPKGGIRPHKRFSINSKKSEVLFIDLILRHLTPRGKAAIIVPEGIIFQISGPYVKLRQSIIENGLVSVISLPKGVFNPYSPVKTSILLFDKNIAPSKEEVLFLKVENDGFSLDKQRNKIPGSDLDLAATKYKEFINNKEIDETNCIKKKDLYAQKRTSFDTNRYLPNYENSLYPVMELGEIITLLDSKRKPIKEADRIPGPYPYYGATGKIDSVDDYIFDEKLVLLGEDGADWNEGAEKTFIINGKTWVNNHAHVMKPNREIILDEYLVYILNSADLNQYITGVTVPKLTQENFKSIEIPVPSIPEQKKILDKLEPVEKEIKALSKSINKHKSEVVLEVKKIWEGKE